jgi:hypothetical protein
MGCDVYANRIGNTGSILWSSSSIPVRVGRCDSTWIVFEPYQGLSATSDGAGGAIVAWTDYRQSASDIFAQRVDSLGMVEWAANGVPVCDVAGPVKNNPLIASDGVGGAIIAWQDTRVFQWHTFAQRIDGNGQRLWPTGGVVVDATSGVKSDHAVVGDGSGGAFLSWASAATGAWNRYVQRILWSGAALWNPTGVALSEGPVAIGGGSMVSDEGGGAICTWLEPAGSTYSLLTQRIDGNGNLFWNPGGTLVASGVRYPWIAPNAAVHDGTGGLITAWEQDGANGIDFYAQHVTAGEPSVSVQSGSSARGLSISIVPNPSHGPTIFMVSSVVAQNANISIFDLQGRRVRNLGTVNLGPGWQPLPWDARDSDSKPLVAGVYVVRLDRGSDALAVRFALVR